MSYNYGGYGNYGWSPVPSAFGGLGQAMSAVAQSAYQWLPLIAQMQAQQDQTTLNLLQQPNIPEDQKRVLIGKLSPRLRNLWPTIPKSVPGSQPNFMTGGQPQDGYNTQANPAFAPVPAPTTDVAATVGATPQLPAPGTSPGTPAPYQPPTMQRVPWIPPTPIGEQTVGEAYGPDNPMFHNMPDAMKARILRMRVTDATQLYPDLQKIAGQALRPPTDVAGLIGGVVVPGQENAAKALGARVTAAIQRGEINEEQGINILRQSGYWQAPQEARTSQLTQFKTRMVGAIANPSIGEAGVTAIKTQMRQAGFKEDEISALTQDAREAVAQQQAAAGQRATQAPKTIMIGGQPFTVPGTEAARLAESQLQREQTRQLQLREFEERRKDRATTRENAAGIRADTRWLHQFDVLNTHLVAAENAAITAQADVDELTRQKQEIDAILGTQDLKGVNPTAYTDAITESTRVDQQLRAAQVKLKAAQAVQKAQQKRYELFTGEKPEPPPTDPGTPPPPPPPPTGTGQGAPGGPQGPPGGLQPGQTTAGRFPGVPITLPQAGPPGPPPNYDAMVEDQLRRIPNAPGAAGPSRIQATRDILAQAWKNLSPAKRTELQGRYPNETQGFAQVPTTPGSTPGQGVPKTPAPNAATMAYWRVWQQEHRPISAARWQQLPLPSRQWLEAEGVQHQ